MKKLTQIEFIKRSKDIHGDKYDYSLVEYINNKIKVKIVCPNHGIFEQRPNDHLNRHGCLSCSDREKLTQKKFEEISNKIHNYQYDYSLSIYKRANSKIKIICKVHGIFEQRCMDHMKGFGCEKCSNRYNYNTDEFIKKSKEIHGDKYDYSLVKYINLKTKVKIICKEHGVFEQIPTNHIHNKMGCPYCGGTKKLTTEEFIKRSKEIHGDKYDYSLVKYINQKTNVKIICPIHGLFKQTLNGHIYQKQGCPNCIETKGENSIQSFLNSNNIEYTKQKTFKNCKNIRMLKFDFYLPKYNICIEYDGIQHFKPIDFFGGENKLKKQKEKDQIKNEYCENNNIHLIRISFNDFNHIEKILSEKLKIK